MDTPGDMFIKIRWVLRACHPIELLECCAVCPLLSRAPLPRLLCGCEPAAPCSAPLPFVLCSLAVRLCARRPVLSSTPLLIVDRPHCCFPPLCCVVCRHRDRGETMLVRVDVATSAASGVLRITLSHHPAGFAPYRIDNCSLETLHARQYKCVLRIALPLPVPDHDQDCNRGRGGEWKARGARDQSTGWMARCVPGHNRLAVACLSCLAAVQGAGAAGCTASVLLPALRLGRAGAAPPPRAGAAGGESPGHL